MTEADTKQSTMNGEADTAAPLDGNGTAPVESATTDLTAVLAERDAYLEQLQRSRADFANYKRRIDQERSQIRERASELLLAQLLPVLDDFQRALAATPEDQRETPLVQGLQLIERKLWSIFERMGVAPIDAVDQPFDPSIHEAVDSDPGTAADTVVAVYQNGYRLGQGLLRPAMVKVGGRRSEVGGDNPPTTDEEREPATKTG